MSSRRLLAKVWLMGCLLVWPGIARPEDEDRWWEQPPGAVPPDTSGEAPWWQQPPGAGISTQSSTLPQQAPVAGTLTADEEQLRGILESPEWQAQHSALSAEQRRALEEKLKDKDQTLTPR